MTCAGRPGKCDTDCRYRLPDAECSLWLAAAGPSTLRQIAGHFGTTGEAIRQTEAKALAKMRRRLAMENSYE